MNTVVEQGAQAFGFSLATSYFQGHQLCTKQPWVQGMSDPAPFRASAAGELAIAAADLTRLTTRQATPSQRNTLLGARCAIGARLAGRLRPRGGALGAPSGGCTQWRMMDRCPQGRRVG